MFFESVDSGDTMRNESENRSVRKILPARSKWKGTVQVTELAPEPLPDQTLEERQIRAWVERPTWIEVDLGAIANNTALIKSLVGPRASVLACLKANAYGHGAVNVARTVLRHGAHRVGVAMVSEAKELREAGIHAPLHVLG